MSDCGAIDDIYLRHKVAPTAAAAAALGVRTGTDLDCGRVYPNLVDAVHQGLVTEAQIDSSVARLFLARFRLGMFDAPERVRWAQIPFSTVDAPDHRALARQAARESIVLLRNAGGMLPLRTSRGTIAVIGPNADQPRVLLGNYNGEPADPITPLRGLREALPGTRVLYARGSDLAEGFPVLDGVPSSVLTAPDGRPGLQAEYFANRTMSGAPLFTTHDSVVRAAWQDGAPRPDMNADDFGVRWTGTFRAPQTGAYRFGMLGTMKVQLWLDDSVVARSVYPSRGDEFPDPRLAQSAAVQLEGGHRYRLRLDAQESYGDAQVQLVWSAPSETLEADAVRVAQQAETVVLVLGLTPGLEGEEMPVQVPGFRGGDRTSLALPAPQQHLMERIVALGKPTVLVLLNGSALSVNWAQAHVPAIVEAWYPGQAGGAAIADVLLGAYNPAGRLPVTFYRDVADLPAFENYAMAGRTYRFFGGTPLYAFGHGLSYTTFAYTHLRTSVAQLSPTGQVTISVDVTNTGTRAGDEVVQLYVRHRGSHVDRPAKELRGYQRVTLAPGQTRTVAFPVAAASLAYWNAGTHTWTVERDRVEFQVGASSADIRAARTIPFAGVAP